MLKLNDKVTVVTGGGSGIGFAIAQRFIAEGATVFIAGRRRVVLDQAVSRIGGNIEAVEADVTHPEELDRLFETVKTKHGKLDILIANSGVCEPSPLDEISEAHYDRTFDLNARATLFTVQKAVRMMSRGGTIVLIGSIAGNIGTPGHTTYNASKAVVRSFSRTWTNEYAARGIRVNTLSPGPIDTPMFEETTEEMRKALSAQIPLGRLGKPEEVAAAALFLASDDSSFIAGAELSIDGGMNQV